MSTELLDQPVNAIVAALARGESTVRALMEHSLQRAEQLQGQCNCFTLLNTEGALRAADAADRQRALGSPLGFLFGVPFAVKDLTPTAGHLTTFGSWSSGDWVPTQDALIVERLRAAGAILIGKTTTPEFAYSSFTQSPRWGVTRNPHDPLRTPGGSSGGSAAAVAGGAVPFAEGTDMGGSVRIPASFCGVVGMKPSLGRIPMTILPSVFDSISHFGPLARSVADAVAFMAATAGPDEMDIFSAPLAFRPSQAAPTALAGRRFAFTMDLGYYAVASEVQAVMYRAIKVLLDAGAIVTEIDLPWSRVVNDRWLDLWAVFMAAYFGERRAAHAARMDPAVLSLMARGDRLGAVDYKRIELLRTGMWLDLVAIFANHEALICPTCAHPAPPATDTDDDYDGNGLDGRFLGLDMTAPFNMVPHCPALSLPAGLTPSGLPVGLQIIGRRFADEHVLALAGGLEAALSMN